MNNQVVSRAWGMRLKFNMGDNVPGIYRMEGEVTLRWHPDREALFVLAEKEGFSDGLAFC